MKAEDLMIGNWVNEDKFSSRPKHHMPYQVSKEDMGYASLMQPILISESWLLVLGMVEGGKLPDNNHFSIRRDNRNYEEWQIYFREEYTAVDIRYVHQLQNFMHATK